MHIEYTLNDFRQTFWTPFQEHAGRIGQTFTVLGRNVVAEEELERSGTPDVLYDIRFSDGFEISAWGEEVCKGIISR